MWSLRSFLMRAGCGVLLLGLCGCTGLSATDPVGALGRWRPKPIQQRILRTLSAGEELEQEEFSHAEYPTAEDLRVETGDYIIGPSDTIEIRIFELLAPDTPYADRIVVDDLGFIWIQHVGQIKAGGLGAPELTERIKEVLYPNILKDPQVSVTVIGQTHRTFAVVGAVREPQRYFLDRADYRLLDALAQAQDVVQRNIPYIYVIRRPAEMDLAEASESDRPAVEPSKIGPPQLSPEKELEELLEAIPGESTGNDKSSLSDGLLLSDASGWSGRARSGLSREQVDRKRVTAAEQKQQGGRKGFDWPIAKARQKLPFSGRVIRIPLEELRAGNQNYNIVIRKNDIVHVPLTKFGFYYMMGNVNGPGTYQLGLIPVTLTQAIAGAGGLSILAEPKKVDIIRQIGEHKQEIVQVDVAKIFAGLQPDYYIKIGDTINVGTSPVSPWLAVLRNGFRATYGFGFVYDRNYADRDAFRPFEWPNLSFW